MGGIFSEEFKSKKGDYKNKVVEFYKIMKGEWKDKVEEVEIEFMYEGNLVFKKTVKQSSDCDSDSKLYKEKEVSDAKVLFCANRLEAKIYTDVDQIIVRVWSIPGFHDFITNRKDLELDVHDDVEIEDITDETKSKDKPDETKSKDKPDETKSKDKPDESKSKNKPAIDPSFDLAKFCTVKNSEAMKASLKALSEHFDPEGYKIKNIKNLKMVDGGCYALYGYSHKTNGNYGDDSRLLDFKSPTDVTVGDKSACVPSQGGFECKHNSFNVAEYCTTYNRDSKAAAIDALSKQFAPGGFKIRHMNDMKMVDGKCAAFYEYSHHGGGSGNDSRLLDFKSPTDVTVIDKSACGTTFKCNHTNLCNMESSMPKNAGHSLFGVKITDLKHSGGKCYAGYKVNGVFKADQIKYHKDEGAEKQNNQAEACKVFDNRC